MKDKYKNKEKKRLWKKGERKYEGWMKVWMTDEWKEQKRMKDKLDERWRGWMDEWWIKWKIKGWIKWRAGWMDE